MPPDAYNFSLVNNQNLEILKSGSAMPIRCENDAPQMLGSTTELSTLTGLGSSSNSSLTATRNKPMSVNRSTTSQTAEKTDSSSSSLLVAVRVRPFNKRELGNMIPSELERYGYSIDKSESKSEYSIEPKAEWGKAPIWKAVHVLDKHVLVFDPPDEDNSFGSSSSALPNNPKLLPRTNRLNRNNPANVASHNQRHKDIRFVYDRIYSENSTQQELYEGTTKGLIESVFEGYNGSVFAYGATGCGKTYTISGTPEDPGIIFLTMKELFERIDQEKETKDIEINLSYLEVYNETIRDLISPDNSNAAGLSLREDIKNGVSVAGLSEHKPTNVGDVMDFVLKGNANRTVCSTAANSSSSRSHAVLQINVKQKLKSGGLKTDITSATLSIIDLAGSERATVTHNKGDRMREGANINRSLLSLANCINALCDPKKKRHIPYRDSKLTRLLKFSLGGNCRTVMITCISPSSTYYEETLNTLKYASRAKNIKTTLNKNTASSQVHIAQYTKKIQEQSIEISRLQKEILELKKRTSSGSFSSVKTNSLDQKGSSGFSNAARSAQETRRMVAAEQAVQDIRNRISQSTASSGDAEYDYASASVLNKLFLESQNELRNWRERFDSSNIQFNFLNCEGSSNETFKRKVEDLLSNLAVQSRLASRHTDHAKNAIHRHQYAAQRCANSSNPSQALSGEQKQRIDQELKILQLTSEKKGLQRQTELLNSLVEGYTVESQNLFSLNAMCLSSLKAVISTFKSCSESITFDNPEEKSATLQAIECLNSIYMSSISTFSLATSRIESAINSVLSSGGPSKVEASLLFKPGDNLRGSADSLTSSNAFKKFTSDTCQNKPNSGLVPIHPTNNGARMQRGMSRKELLSCATNNMRLARLVSPRARKSRVSIVGSGFSSKPPISFDNKMSLAANSSSSKPFPTLLSSDPNNTGLTYMSALRRNPSSQRRASVVSTLPIDHEYKPSPRKRMRSGTLSDSVSGSTGPTVVAKDSTKKVGFAIDRSIKPKRLSVSSNDIKPISHGDAKKGPGTANKLNTNSRPGSISFSVNSHSFGTGNNPKINGVPQPAIKNQSVNFANTQSFKIISPGSLNHNTLNIASDGNYVPPVADAVPKKSILKGQSVTTANLGSSVIPQRRSSAERSSSETTSSNSTSTNFRSSLARNIKNIIKESLAASPTAGNNVN